MEYSRLLMMPASRNTSGMLGYSCSVASFSEYPSPINPTANPVVLFTSCATPNCTCSITTLPIPTMSSANGPIALDPSPNEVLKAG